jgi:hypothetical protein
MYVRDMMHPDGRVFLKSEWGPISDSWPCVSFTKRSVGDYLRLSFRPGKDILLYVGTTNPEMTENPEHRSRILSAVVIQPNQVLETRKIVPSASWQASFATWGDRWPHAMAVTRAANALGPPFPDARSTIPAAYRAFGEIANRGGVVEAIGEERDAAMSIEVEETVLRLSDDVRRYLAMAHAIAQDIDLSVRQEISRMALLIEARVRSSGAPSARINPQRHAPNLSDIVVVLTAKWKSQRGRCLLCGGRIIPKPANPMLQASADRIDSSNGAYSEDNVQITHLACNWAKNQYGTSHFEEWLDTVRGEDEKDDPAGLFRGYDRLIN